MHKNDSWDSSASHVMASLQRLESEIKELRTQVWDMKARIVVLELKSGLWGALAGIVATLGIVGAQMLLK